MISLLNAILVPKSPIVDVTLQNPYNLQDFKDDKLSILDIKAVDQSGAARLTLAAAERYAALFGAELRALSVFEPLPVIPGVTQPYETGEYYAMSEELLTRDVWSLIRTPGVERIVRYGMAVKTILREVSEWGADLLVVGSHGKGWAERVLVGSVTERLLNRLPTSLIVVPVRAAVVAEPRGANVAAAV